MRHVQRASVAITAAAPLLLTSGVVLHGDLLVALRGADRFLAISLGALGASVVLVALGGLVATRAPVFGRRLVFLGLLAWLGHLLVAAIGRPVWVLAGFVGVAVAAHRLWPVAPTPGTTTRRHVPTDHARGAAFVTLGGTLAILLAGVLAVVDIRPILGASLVVSWLAALRAAFQRDSPTSKLARSSLLVVAAIALALLAFAWGDPTRMVVAALLVPFASVTLLKPRRGRFRTLRAIVDGVMGHPARVLVVTFFGLSLIGALMLRLPGISTGDIIAPMDAAFTATSAVCVTGLIVLDTPNAFSGFGQVVLLLLIQVGGLGIMSFSTVAIAAIGRRISLKHEGAIAGLFSGDRADINASVRRLLVTTFGFELAGAVLLAISFRSHGDSFGEALWRGLFTSISAFCNAGFALQSDSLVPYQTDPVVLHVVALLIIVGGLSPAVIAEAPALMRGRAVSVQTRIVLVMSVGLLVVGAMLIAGLEWEGAFAHLDLVDRLHAAWFQSVTLRTAGFNSVDFGALAPATVWLMCAFMIIGGSPGGTAGGVKTTTAYVLLAAVYGAMQGRWEAAGFRRRISDRTVYKAAAIVTIALLFIVFGVVAVEVTQALGLGEALFEVVSALGTVGLSVGATGELDHVGKIIIMVCMFVGRVGPLTLFLFLRERHSEALWHLPEEEIDVG